MLINARGIMKKKVSIFLCLAIVLSMLAPFYCVFKDRIERNDAISFCNQVNELNKADNALNEIEYIDEEGSSVYSQYENRLIVKSTNNFKSNASKIIKGPEYTILQYESKQMLNSDYDSLKSQGIVAHKDQIICASDFDLSLNRFFDEEEENAEVNNNQDSAYSACAAQYAKSYFAQSESKFNDVTVGVIDTGVYYPHEVFNNRYIDSKINFSSTGDTNSTLDDNGHGTAVASIIAMSTPDNVKIKGYKVLDSKGYATTSAMLAVIEYIINEKDRPDIINLSIGGYELADDDFQALISESLKRLSDKGVTICAAAGNENVPAQYNCISGSSSVITVASCSSSGEFSAFSNYGDAIDITAPGESVNCAVNNTKSDYSSADKNGTSYASAFVSAACSYVLMQNPHYSSSEIKQTVLSKAIGVSPDDEYYFGKGVVNLANLIDKPSKVDIHPSLLGGEYDGKRLSVSFDVPEGTSLLFSKGAVTPAYEVYNEPITIDENTTLTYALIKDGEYISDICSQSYILNYTANADDIVTVVDVISQIKVPDKKINLIIPDDLSKISLTTVGASAFKGKSYNKVILPDSVSLLGTESFAESQITEIVARGVESFSGIKVFYNCKNLKSTCMPNLERVSDSAFEGCVRLNYIDFGDNIKKFTTKLFAGTGIINASFPNAQSTAVNTSSIFAGSRIFTCNIPQIDELQTEMFYNCEYLYKLKTKPIKAIFPNALNGCKFIRKMDLTSLTRLYNSGLAGVWIENFYAPKITAISNTLSSITDTLGSKYNHSEIINLPNLGGPLTNLSLYYSTTKQLILPNVTAITSSKTFYNTPLIEFIYLPKATQYFSPAVSVGSLDEILGYKSFCEYPKPKLVFIPNVKNLYDLTFKNVDALYATQAKIIDITLTDANRVGNIIVSDKIGNNGISVNCANEKYKPNVIAPEGKVLNGNYTYVESTKCKYVGNKDNMLKYACNDSEFCVPIEYITEYYGTGMLNSDKNKTHALLFDFHDDNIINAKDFAIYNRILGE